VIARLALLLAAVGGAVVVLATATAAPPRLLTRTQDFTADPGWEGRYDHAPGLCVAVQQNFGWTATDHLGTGVPGELGGTVWRASRGANYGLAIPPVGFGDSFDASGRFALPQTATTAGVLFGWYSSTSFDTHKPSSIMFRFDDGDVGGERVFVVSLIVVSQSRLLSGGGAQLIVHPGQVYDWTLSHAATGGIYGLGDVVLTVAGVGTLSADVRPDQWRDGAVFDRFGISNLEMPGGPVEVYYGDLALDGATLPLGSEPVGWVGAGNHDGYDDCDRYRNDFGWHQGGSEGGEAGGTVWRAERRAAWYADRLPTTPPLTLAYPLTASGTLRMTHTGIDPDIFVGWFDSREKYAYAQCADGGFLRDRLGFRVGGLARLGDRARPYIATRRTQLAFQLGRRASALVTHDGTVHHWRLHYIPILRAGAPRGLLMLTVDGIRMSLAIDPTRFDPRARFDRFGIASVTCGGGPMTLYLDDLSYTAGVLQ